MKFKNNNIFFHTVPLQIAVEKGNVSLVKFLIELPGVDVNVKTI